jgi:NAD(P)-dependent dehydrogenase (short-subunit alcohol dehydrogenase family)
MAAPFPSFTKTWHTKPYEAISPSAPSLSTIGKVILITGGGKGIGKAIACAFAEAGAQAIIITGRSQPSLDEAKLEIMKSASAPTKVSIHQADVTDACAMNAVFSNAKKEFGPIDVVVSNAGYLNTPGPLSHASLEDYWRVFEVNVKGTIVVAKEFVSTGACQQNSTFISISSGAAHIPYIADYSAYSSSKLAAVKTMEYFQHEQPSIRVFQVQPGSIATGMQTKSGREAHDEIGNNGKSQLRNQQLTINRTPRSLLCLARRVSRGGLPLRQIRMGKLGCSRTRGKKRGHCRERPVDGKACWLGFSIGK